MSEHWKSTPKYWCKHCNIYVKDTPFERKQHESTAKHQGNLKRFLTGIQKDHARNEREKDKARAEVERLNRITGASGASGPSSAAATAPARAPTFTKPSKGAANLSAADQKRQWAQLADMGIAVPEHARAEMAMPGDWQVVSRRVDADGDGDGDGDADAKPPTGADEKLNVGIRKRKVDDHDDDDDEQQHDAGDAVVGKGWGTTTKAYPGAAATGADDLDALISKSIVKKSKPLVDEPSSNQEHPALASATQHSARPTTNGEPSNPLHSDHRAVDAETKSTLSTRILEIKTETGDGDIKPDSPQHAPEVAVPVFKKRRAKQSPATTG